SGSMAPGLPGPHRHWVCSICRAPFDCELEVLADDAMVLCPACGAPNDPESGTDRPGARIWVDRSAYAWRSPRRGEVVVFQSPQAAGELLVKRVAALPGETVRLAGATADTRLPHASYFVVGDNRERSVDSRHGGPIDGSRIVGRAMW